MTEADLYRFLSQFTLGVLASVQGNSPQSALVGIAVTPQLEIVFDTLDSTRKYRNLIAEPACSLVIGWTGEQTVQYEGRATRLDGPELPRYQKIYFQAFPDGPGRMSWPGIVYFVVRPAWIRFSDYGQSPPLIREFTFADPMPLSGGR
jgi:uncharacterized pyridoxamine 5'-phosphate oxidase family protein